MLFLHTKPYQADSADWNLLILPLIWKEMLNK